MELEVVIGTYDHVLFSFMFTKADETEDMEIWQFAPKFTDQSHAGCISCVASGGRYMASGSSDEQIRLYDLKKHVEVGTIVKQSGTITCMQFVKSTHMLSGSEDGTVCIWNCKTWDCDRELKGHKAAVNSISVHPSGRLALSVSKDKTIKTWNLLTGRPAYTTSLKSVGELVRWSPSGESYAIVSGSLLMINKISGTDEPIVYENGKHILAVEYLTETCLIIAGDSEDIVLYDTESKSPKQKFQAHEKRTKAVCFVEHPYDEGHIVLFTTSTDGSLKASRLNLEDLSEPPMAMATTDIPGRPTCIAIKKHNETKPKKASKDAESSAKDSTVIERTEDAPGKVSKEDVSEEAEEAEDKPGQTSDVEEEASSDPPKAKKKRKIKKKKQIAAE